MMRLNGTIVRVGILIALASSAQAQTIPADFHGWFLGAVAGKPFGQQTLVELAPSLPCVGSQITPPNALGERTKIWDPTISQWVRVGFGEGTWVWIPQGVVAPPIPLPCSSTSQPPPPPPVPPADEGLAEIRAQLTYVQTQLGAVLAQNERIYADEVNRLTALHAQIQAHDEKPGAMEQTFGNRYVQIALAVVSALLAQQQVTK